MVGTCLVCIGVGLIALVSAIANALSSATSFLVFLITRPHCRRTNTTPAALITGLVTLILLMAGLAWGC